MTRPATPRTPPALAPVLAFAACLALLPAPARATAEGERQAASFASIYATTCMKYLSDLETLRAKLRAVPALPPAKAAFFLQDAPGDAWPVPDTTGTFVLALPRNKNLCAVYARRADTAAARRRFTALVARAPAPLAAAAGPVTRARTVANGATETLSYTWSAPGAPRRLLFMLTLAPAPDAGLQVLGTASVIRP